MDNPTAEGDELIDVDAERPWLALENTLSGKDAESFARAIEEAFPIEPINPLRTKGRTTIAGDGLRISEVLQAEYDDATHSLRLLEPLEGLADHEKVSVIVQTRRGERPWSDLRGLLSGKEGEEFARVIEEAFPIEPVKK